jgi:hypothetical protein
LTLYFRSPSRSATKVLFLIFTNTGREGKCTIRKELANNESHCSYPEQSKDKNNPPDAEALNKL